MGTESAILEAEMQEVSESTRINAVERVTSNALLHRGREVILAEMASLTDLVKQMNMEFVEAAKLILNCKGRLIVCGMGKSGIIGQKIAATFASTGTQAYSLHPGEAFHGDLGMVDPSDVFIAISNSGETGELLQLLPFLRDNGNNIIAITNKPDSTLAKASTVTLELHVSREACIHQLAPTSSTTSTLALGDALAITVMESRDFKPRDFARFHPGGALGKMLLKNIKNEMITDIPFVNECDTLHTVMLKLIETNLGIVVVKQEMGGSIMGVITDGDIKRIYADCPDDFGENSAGIWCTKNYLHETISARYVTAVDKMTKHGITALPIFDTSELVGILKL